MYLKNDRISTDDPESGVDEVGIDFTFVCGNNVDIPAPNDWFESI
jgi:hypothetical protein